MVRIGVDAIHLSRNRKGIGRVERSLIQTLVSHQLDHEIVVFLDRDPATLGLPTSAGIKFITRPTYNLLVWEHIQLPFLAQRHEVHCLLTLADRVGALTSMPVVMYLFETPDHRLCMNSRLGSNLYQGMSDAITRRLFPRSLKQAVRIVAASQATRLDLLAHYRVPESKIEVLHAAAEEIFKPSTDQTYLQLVRGRLGMSDGYVLHFSTGDPRDNSIVALKAFAHARLPASKKLALAGGSQTFEVLAGVIDELGIREKVIPISFLPDHELVELYQAADAYLDPSLYEGFGLQAVEAMACGVPVICSNTTALPEVVGDAALLYAPFDVAGFAKGIESVMNNSDQAETMRTHGLSQARQFSWDRTVARLLHICSEVVA